MTLIKSLRKRICFYQILTGGLLEYSVEEEVRRMRNFILILALILLFAIGFVIMRSIDNFIENGGFKTE
ncbi:MAG: hypothetical protein SOU16_10380 [Faecalimonas sp.]|nr:hypothetical protein [Faecalimonas sp.]